MLARRLAWVSTTPLGMPSDPEVKRITAGVLSGSKPSRGTRRPVPHRMLCFRRTSNLSRVLIRVRTSSSRWKRMPAASNGPMSNLAFSRKVREVMTSRIPASRAHCRSMVGPVEKLRTAGVCPVDHKASSVSGMPLTLGRSTPTRVGSLWGGRVSFGSRLWNCCASSSAPTMSRR